MAELPQYRRAGVLTAGIGRVNPVGDREAIETTGLLAQKLDRMSQWAFGEAMNQAKEQGLQYGAENPVTLQQLRDAVTAGLPPERLFQRRGTAFGDAARAMQIAAVTSDVELDAQTRLNALKLGVERGDVELANAQKEIQAMLDGYGQTMAGVDPKASLKLRASLGTAANSAFLAMSNAYAKKQQELQKIGVDNWIATAVAEQVRTHIEAGDTVDPETGKTINPLQRVDATLRRTLMGSVARIGDPVYARQAIKEFDKVVSEARINALTTLAQDPKFAVDRDGKFDPLGAVARADRGDFGQYSSVFKAMPADEQAKVRTALRQAAADRWTAEQHVRARQKEDDTLAVNGLIREFYTANPARSREILARLDTISTTTGAITGKAIQELVKARRDGDGQGNEQGEFILRTEVLSGKIRTPEQLWARSREVGVKPKQANEVLGFFVARQNEDEREAERVARAAARIVPGTINPTAAQNNAYFAITREIDRQFNAQMDAHQRDPAKHPAPVRSVIAGQVARKRQEAAPARGIEQRVNELNAMYGPSGSVKLTGVTFSPDTSLNDIRAALQRDGVTGNDLKMIEQKLNEIKALQRSLDTLRE